MDSVTYGVGDCQRQSAYEGRGLLLVEETTDGCSFSLDSRTVTYDRDARLTPAVEVDPVREATLGHSWVIRALAASFRRTVTSGRP